MRSKLIGVTLALIGLVIGAICVRVFFALPDALPGYRAGLAAGLVLANPATPEQWLQAQRVVPLVFLALALLLVIAGCLGALCSRYASAACLGTAAYAVISYVLLARYSWVFSAAAGDIAFFIPLLTCLGTAAVLLRPLPPNQTVKWDAPKATRPLP